MVQVTAPQIPKWVLSVLNHLYEVERKLAASGDNASIGRNVERMKDAFRDEHLFYEDPMGQPFNETRTDLDASISGDSTTDLVVTEVIKPVIRVGRPDFSTVIQKGIVVVKSKEEGTQQ